MSYQAEKIEKKWQSYWEKNQTFKSYEDKTKQKFYILDMFPYPSGAGLHVGHPLGYIASDIFARYKRHKGFSVLHPMGYDAFGLPAEQYAIQTGQHPAITTEQNIKRYREQLDQIGFSFDWSREIKTCEASYYKWTQWAFIEMFHSYYDPKEQKARSIKELEEQFEKEGKENIFSATEWKTFSPQKKEKILQEYRIAYLADMPVNWCPALGTVLANDEIKDGLSVRGGHPVEQRVMKQWSLRISTYAERLLEGLNRIDWSESIKEMQRNWIGKSEGAEVNFSLKNQKDLLTIFTTRPDTIFGVSFLVLAPESEWTLKLTQSSERSKVEAYLEECKKRTERERQADVKKVSGVFTGSYAIHPFTKKEIPIWVGDYVLGGYGTGAIMAVPAHDSRDYAFAKHFHLPILEVVSGGDIEKESYDAKEGTLIHSDFLNGLEVNRAIKRAIEEIKKQNLGEHKINYRLRDAIFSRQRYWGEPIPVYFKDEIPHTLSLNELPLELPAVDAYLPTEQGEPPLARAKNWKTKENYPLEFSTMPGFAGSSAYYFRYMDPHNNNALAAKNAVDYWQDVDLYIGGSEHATGHLIYSRFWCKFLFDRGFCPKDEPFKKLVNQGMIQGQSKFVYRVKNEPNKYVSYGLRKKYETQEIHVNVEMVKGDILDTEAFRSWRPEFKNAIFELENTESGGETISVYKCGTATEKMSKSLFNVVTPDTVIKDYGADTLRLFEMFLGPLEQSKPWNMSGIEGVSRFLQKTWRWMHNGQEDGDLVANNEKPKEEVLRILHQTIEKITKDIEALSFNTAVAQFMICVNELSSMKVQNREILETFTILLSPFAPHLAEELWEKLGHSTSISEAKWPEVNPSYLTVNSVRIVIQINGKLKDQFNAPVGISNEEAFSMALARDIVKNQVQGKEIKKKIFVPGKLINFVVG